MVLESRREALPVPHDDGTGTWLDCFRVRAVSGRIMVDEAGLDPTTLDETELLRGLSHGAVPWRRNDAGLI